MSGPAISETATLEDLVARIRDAFPRLVFSDARLIDAGDDHLVVVLDDRWVARFPRSTNYRGLFAAELNLLSKLATHSPLPVPRYHQVSDDGSFGIYGLIQGRNMTPHVFANLDPAERNAAIASLSSFLSTLHALPEKTIRQSDGNVARTWTGEQFATLYRDTRRAKIAGAVPASALARFDAFHDALRTLAPGPPRLAHNDLTDDHILVSDGRISGIIDFTDAAFGDPAIDFAWFWRLGEANVDLLLRKYRYGSQDRSLKTRSHWTFVRYMINQLWYGPQFTWGLTTEQMLEEVEPHLQRLGF